MRYPKGAIVLSDALDVPALRKVYQAGHATAWQRQHERVWAIGVGCELFSQQPAGVAAIAKESWLDEYWLHAITGAMEITRNSRSRSRANRGFRTLPR